jgi:endonuclease YncB( thermonuclease family)
MIAAFAFAFALAGLTVRGLTRRTRAWWLLATVSATAPGGCAALNEPQHSGPSGARIVRVVDGDTIVVRNGERRVIVRLLGVDTPETHGGPAECGGIAASHHLARIIPTGTRVRLVADPRSGDTRDRYGRMLAHVDAPRGDIGERQLRAGLAHVYRYRGRRFSRLDRYRQGGDVRASNRPRHLVGVLRRLPCQLRAVTTATTAHQATHV